MAILVKKSRTSATTMTRLGALLHRLPTLKIKETFPHLQAFTLFPELPLELRRRIIAFAAHEPREVLLYHDGIYPTIYYVCNSSTYVSLQQAVPAILHTSVEFRVEGLRYYTWQKFSSYCNWMLQKRLAVKRYINFDVDYMRLINIELYDRLGDVVSKEVCGKMKYVASEWDAYKTTNIYDKENMSDTLEIFKDMPSLIEWKLTQTFDWPYENRDQHRERMGDIVEAFGLGERSKNVLNKVKSSIETSRKTSPQLRNAQLKWKWGPEGLKVDEDLYPMQCDGKWTQDLLPSHRG